MVSLNVCRNLYPTWKSTRRYLNKLEGIAFFPEESLDFGENWDIQIVVEYSSGKNLWIIGSHKQSIVTVHDGVLEKYHKESEPINFNIEGVALTILARICSSSLTPSPQYSAQANLVFISSAIPFDRDRIIQIHKHNLTDDPFFLLSCYKIDECVIAREKELNLGEIVRKSVDSYLKYDLVKSKREA